jgi:glycosyltransferase involved in cell wall biosynthesis
MSNKKRITIYVRNKDITPSSYYRIVQYSRFFNGNVCIREIAPRKIYHAQLNLDKRKRMKKFLLGAIYYLTMVVRASTFLLIDSFFKPQYIIVSKTFCPRYTPLILRALISYVAKSFILYWDFDDFIFANNEISTTQKEILEKYSKNIIVTHEFLKSKIKYKYQDKVILLPTTDGDMQGFNEAVLIKERKETLKNEIRLVWVATSGNMPNLIKIIGTLDEAAKTLKKTVNKQLILTVVCNKPLNIDVNYLMIRNIKWTRDVAKEEIFYAHIGIMPLISNEYSLGKGGFKLVQYISTGLPIIASKVGFNQEVIDERCGILVDDEINNDGWIEAISRISIADKVWERYSVSAYERWNKHFPFDLNLQMWDRLLNSKEVEN